MRAPLPLVIAHRGASEAAPENTIAAFERALADAGEGAPAALLENLVSKVESRVLLPRDDDWTVVALTRIQEGSG